MKVLVEFDLTDDIQHKLYQQVKNTMLAHTRVDIEPSKPQEITKEELTDIYKQALEVSEKETHDLLIRLQVDHGNKLSDWNDDVRWMASQQFSKLLDRTEDRF